MTTNPADPTGHPPGSAGKIAVLAERAALELPLWHPLDARGPLPAINPNCAARTERVRAGEIDAALLALLASGPQRSRELARRVGARTGARRERVQDRIAALRRSGRVRRAGYGLYAAA